MERGIRAEETLNKFYNTIFVIGSEFNPSPSVRAANTGHVRSLVVSDCAVIFVDNIQLGKNKMRDLESVLRFVKRVNQALITPNPSPPIMTTCSIDYGRFKYQDRIEFRGIGKAYFFGQPYVNVFLDNEKLKNKPGYCRILRNRLRTPDNLRRNHPFSLLQREENYNYFYWMLDSLDHLPQFKRRYEDISQSVYPQMISLLQRAAQKSNARA